MLDEPHQDHESYVGLKLLCCDRGPVSKFFSSHAFQCKLVALFNDERQECLSKKERKDA